MKKLSILFLSVFALGMTIASCSKSDSPAPAPFEGKWTFTTLQALDSSGNLTGTAQNFPGLTGANDASCGKNDIMTFNAATPTPNAVYTDYPSSGCTSQDTPFTYTKTGSNLIIDFGNGTPLTAIITSVTSTNLTLKVTESGTSYLIVLKRS